ncbi:choice-of-anchor J domain-containing protein, partial [Arthrospira platensis SPKY1]|nr:choice-of-anchor J domain-containing protein [Arthrospira platensis SPKY1]
ICFASVPGEGISANNDWMITPQITLGNSNNILKFWAKSCDTQYGNEKFRVGISTSGTAASDFTTISPGAFVTNPATAEWIEYTYNLDNYSGQAVRIAINCISDDQFGFAIDDFTVTTGTLSAEDFFKSNFSLYPNPANDILNINGNQIITSVEITDLNARVVSVWNGELQNVQLNTS